MTLIIDLPRPIEDRLLAEATKAGVSKTAYATELLTKSLPVASINAMEQKALNAPSIALLQSWLKRSPTSATCEEQALAEADLAEFMKNMNSSRLESGERLLYPDVEPTVNDEITL